MKRTSWLPFVVALFLFTGCGRADESDFDFLSSGESDESFVVVGDGETFFKSSTADSATLNLGTGKCLLNAGTKVNLRKQPEFAGGHYYIQLVEPLPECSFTQGYVFRDHISKTSLKALFSGNMRAFLDTIAYAEGTNDSYDYIFSYVKFYSFAGHPRRLICSGGYCSDAAGRYQIKSTTWDEVRRAVGLTDFSPQSQDRAAVQLIRWRGGYERVEQISNMNNFSDAAYSVRYEWASMPHSPYGQPTHSVSKLWAKYQEYRDRY